MSLLDVLDSQQSSGYAPTKKKKRASYNYDEGFIPGPSGGGIGGSQQQSARNSRERGIPERIDINSFIQPQEELPVPLQIAEMAGRAPGFISERPLALVDTLLGDEQGKSPLDEIGSFGPIKLAGEIIGNIQKFPAAVANSSTIESLDRGFREGFADSDPINSALDRIGQQIGFSSGLASNPVTGPLSTLIRQLNENSPEDRKINTWGDFKREAALRGFTEQDLLDYREGRKGSFDFGDKAMSGDPATSIGLSLGSDPTNLLFGAGAALKLASGAKFASSVIKAGAMAEKLQAPSLVAEGIADAAHVQGIARQTTWYGLARYFGNVGRGIGKVPGAASGLGIAARGASIAGKGLKAYQKAAIGLSIGQTAIKASESTPLSGFLEPLYELNNKVWDNQPLSQNMAWSLFSAFHFDVGHLTAQVAKGAGKTQRAILGDDVRAAVLNRLSEGEGWGRKASHADVLQALGGDEGLNNLITHTVAQGVFERIMKNPKLRAALTHYDSIDEAILSNAKVGEMVRSLVIDDIKNGRVRGRDVVSQLERWYGVRSGNEIGLDFPWDGRNAVERWTEYGAAVHPVSSIFKERGDIVLGLVDQVMFEDLRNMGTALGISAKGTTQVPVSEIRRWLSRYPALLKTQRGYWQRFLAKDMNGQTVSLREIQGKIKRAQKDAPTVRDLTGDVGRMERKAALDEINARDAVTPQVLEGTGQVLVSRMRPAIAKRLRMNPSSVTDVMASRSQADVAAFEERIGTAMSDLGFEVESVTQAIGAYEGHNEPSVQLIMPTATVDDLRLAAALAGRAGRQDSAGFVITGERMRELLIEPNGYEVVIALPQVPGRAQLQQITEALNKEFVGYTLNDTAGTISVLVPGGAETELSAQLQRVGAAIEGFFPPDIMGDTGLRTSVHSAYIEFITQKKGAGDASYAEVFAAARRAGDPRARAGQGLESSLAYRKPVESAVEAGVGPDEAVGRQPSNSLVTESGGLLPPAQRVGTGTLAQAGKGSKKYVYHVTTEDALAQIAEQGLKTHSPDYRGKRSWSDGGSGARNWYYGSPKDALASNGDGGPVLRVARDDAGSIRTDIREGTPYSQKRVVPAHIEVLGGDGKWYALESFFESDLEPDIAAAAQRVAPAYASAEAAPDNLTAGMRALEDQGRPVQGRPDEAALMAELASLTENTVLDEATAARAQDVQRRLEAARLAKGEAQIGRVKYMAQRDVEVSSQIPLHRSLHDLDDVSRADLMGLEAVMREHYPAYTLQKSPNPAILMAHEGDIAARYLRDRAALGNILADHGVFSRPAHLLNWLFSPVKNTTMARNAKQALMNELIPHGASPKDVDAFLARLDEEARKHTVGPWELPIFRNGQSLTQQAINKIAAGDPQAKIKGVFSDKTVAAIGRDNFARVLDRAGNRFIRLMDQRAQGGSKLAAAIGRAYGAYQKTWVGDTTRFVGKTMYPLFRFFADPRWWAMNILEADIINGTKYGIGATRFRGAHKAEPSDAALIQQFGHAGAVERKNLEHTLLGEDTGWMYTRRHGGYVTRAFDAARPETVMDTLRTMTDDELYGDLKDLVREMDARDGNRMRSDVEIMDEDIVQAIDRSLYSIDSKGAKATFLDELALQHVGPEETKRLYPFLQKVWERNQQTYDDIVKALSGNPNRTNLERIGNSYWLYWPLSYQVKAARWLVGIMSDRFLGAKTNLAPAALYAHYVDEHRKRMASDPNYVALFEKHPTAWFMAQMMMPITPGDVGVSLNRALRYGGGELGLWGEYKNADDPVTAAGAMLSMGPTYTAELLARLGRELFRRPKTNIAP